MALICTEAAKALFRAFRLRAIWRLPKTRAGLLEALANEGFGKEQMAEMQRIIDAENSDLFDVLAYVAYTLPPLTREERATKAKTAISNQFTTPQQVYYNNISASFFGAKEKLS